MLKRIKHFFLGHEFVLAWRTFQVYEQHETIRFVCRCGAWKTMQLPGVWSPNTAQPATDDELRQLKKMAGIE